MTKNHKARNRLGLREALSTRRYGQNSVEGKGWASMRTQWAETEMQRPEKAAVLIHCTGERNKGDARSGFQRRGRREGRSGGKA